MTNTKNGISIQHNNSKMKTFYKSNKMIVVYDLKLVNHFIFHLSGNYIPHRRHDLNFLYKLLNVSDEECFKKYEANTYDLYLGYKSVKELI